MPDALLLRRHTTPLFSASLRSVAVETPATPPVVHTAALGGSGPGWSGQLAFDVHCAPVALHLPTCGQLTMSIPGDEQGRLVMLHIRLTSGHSTAELQEECVFEHVLIFEQQNCVWPWLHAVAKHAGGGTILVPLQVPKATGQPQLVSVVPLN